VASVLLNVGARSAQPIKTLPIGRAQLKAEQKSKKQTSCARQAKRARPRLTCPAGALRDDALSNPSTRLKTSSIDTANSSYLPVQALATRHHSRRAESARGSHIL
jgi:hypothetical protein